MNYFHERFAMRVAMRYAAGTTAIALSTNRVQASTNDASVDTSVYFKPVKVGSMTYANRVAMAPLTRCRTSPKSVPGELIIKHYADRASAGLIITEATNVSPNSLAFEYSPGIWNKEQVTGWKKVTEAVHSKNKDAKIFTQLWHTGRVSSKYLTGQQPMSPSGFNDDLNDIHVWAKLDNAAFTRIYASESRQMTIEDIKNVVAEFGNAAKNAKEAGFDGVEIHSANGYLLHQFLSSTLNKRTDAYGGSTENRARLLREIILEVQKHLPLSSIGVRISPFVNYNNTRDSNPVETYAYVASMLEELGVGYVHLCDFNAVFGPGDMEKILAVVKPRYKGVIIANGGLTPETGAKMIQDGSADIIAFGRLFISNPDLADRIKQKGPYNTDTGHGHYGGDEKGYNDYPKLPTSP